MTEINSAILEDAKVLWNFHIAESGPHTSDFILALGSHDERVAQHAASLFLAGFAPLLVTSGGFGKITRNSWKVTEGERFAAVAQQMGVPSSAILIESEASNTGANISNTKALMEQRQLFPKTGVLVAKPYMCRRAYATAGKQWPDIKWFVSAPKISFEAYPNNEVSLVSMINLMVGDLQRLKLYGENGFQLPTEVPTDVWESYERLINAGFDAFVIRG